MVYLHGGPGGAILAEADLFVRSIVDPFVSEPATWCCTTSAAPAPRARCPECYEAWPISTPSSSSSATSCTLELRDDYVDALLDRVRRTGLGGRDTDSTSPTTRVTTHADDLLDLTRALGYDRVNLYGNSYGTRLAQTMMRDHPGPVRSVILSGVYPIEEPTSIGSTPGAFEDGIPSHRRRLCSRSPSCRPSISPTPSDHSNALVADLDADPPTIRRSRSTTNPRIPSCVQMPATTSSTSSTDSSTALDGAALIPDLLVDLEAGDLARLERIAPGRHLQHLRCRRVPRCPVPGGGAVHDAPRSSHPRRHATSTMWDRINLPPGLAQFADLIEICEAWE